MTLPEAEAVKSALDLNKTVSPNPSKTETPNTGPSKRETESESELVTVDTKVATTEPIGGQNELEDVSKKPIPAASAVGTKTPSEALSKQFADLNIKWEKLINKMGEDSLDEITTGSDMSTYEDEDEYQPPAVGKLRALARVVMINLRWAKNIRMTHDHTGFEARYGGLETGQAVFKVGDFMASKRVISGLTRQEKDSLKLHPIARTQGDSENILKVLERYKCFDKFTLEVRKKLAVWVRYDTFDDARVLLRQGHEPYSMYFILTGSVSFKASGTDPRTGRTNFYPLGVRGPNSTIGEIELLSVDERRSTGVTQGDVELLRVDEDPFNEILRSSFESFWDERFAVLRSAQTFESWTDTELKILNENSSMIIFEENKPILTDVFGPSAFSYFIQKGKCAMVKDVIFERSFYGTHFRNPVYQALEPEDERRWISPSKLKEHPELEGHHLHITEFKEGDYFGVGENLRRTHIIALTTVECLTIPRSVFEKADRNQFLEDLKADLEDAIPSEEQILDEWLALKFWETFKKAHLRRFWTKIQAEDTTHFFNMHKKYRLNSLLK